MTHSEIADKFGRYPFEFFNVLLPNDKNKFLNLETSWDGIQYLINELKSIGYNIEMNNYIIITDNGDYIFSIDKGTLIVNPRSKGIELHREHIIQILENPNIIKSKILPNDFVA